MGGRTNNEKVYGNIYSKLGIDSQDGIHSLRHGFASHLFERGASLHYIQELFGHSSAKTIGEYTHVVVHELVKIRSPIAGLLKGVLPDAANGVNVNATMMIVRRSKMQELRIKREEKVKIEEPRRMKVD